MHITCILNISLCSDFISFIHNFNFYMHNTSTIFYECVRTYIITIDPYNQTNNSKLLDVLYTSNELLIFIENVMRLLNICSKSYNEKAFLFSFIFDNFHHQLSFVSLFNLFHFRELNNS